MKLFFSQTFSKNSKHYLTRTYAKMSKNNVLRSIYAKPEPFNITKFIKLTFSDVPSRSSKEVQNRLDVLHHFMSLIIEPNGDRAREQFESFTHLLTWVLFNTDYIYAKEQISSNSKPLSVVSRFDKLNPYIEWVKKETGVPSSISVDNVDGDDIVNTILRPLLYPNTMKTSAIDLIQNYIERLNQSTSGRDFKYPGLKNMMMFVKSYKTFITKFSSFLKDPKEESDSRGYLYDNWLKFYTIHRMPDNRELHGMSEVLLGMIQKPYTQLYNAGIAQNYFEREKNQPYISMNKVHTNLWDLIKSPTSKPTQKDAAFSYLRWSSQVELILELVTSMENDTMESSEWLRKYSQWIETDSVAQLLKVPVFLMDSKDIEETYDWIIKVDQKNNTSPAGSVLAFIVAQRIFRTIETQVVFKQEIVRKLEVIMLYTEQFCINRFISSVKLNPTEQKGATAYFSNVKGLLVKRYSNKIRPRIDAKQIYFTDHPDCSAVSWIQFNDQNQKQKYNDWMIKFEQKKQIYNSFKLIVPYTIGVLGKFKKDIQARYFGMLRDLTGIRDTSSKWLPTELRTGNKEFIKYATSIDTLESLVQEELTIYAEKGTKLRSHLIVSKLKNKTDIFDNVQTDEEAKITMLELGSEAQFAIQRIQSIASRVGLIFDDSIPTYDFGSLMFTIDEVYKHIVSGEQGVRTDFINSYGSEERSIVIEEIKQFIEYRAKYPNLMREEKHAYIFAIMVSVVVRLRELIRNVCDQFITTTKLLNAVAASSLLFAKNEEALIFFMLKEMNEWMSSMRVGVRKPEKQKFKLQGVPNQQDHNVAFPYFVVRENDEPKQIPFSTFKYDEKDVSFKELFAEQSKITSMKPTSVTIIKNPPEPKVISTQYDTTDLYSSLIEPLQSGEYIPITNILIDEIREFNTNTNIPDTVPFNFSYETSNTVMHIVMQDGQNITTRTFTAIIDPDYKTEYAQKTYNATKGQSLINGPNDGPNDNIIEEDPNTDEQYADEQYDALIDLKYFIRDAKSLIKWLNRDENRGCHFTHYFWIKPDDRSQIEKAIKEGPGPMYLAQLAYNECFWISKDLQTTSTSTTPMNAVQQYNQIERTGGKIGPVLLKTIKRAETMNSMFDGLLDPRLKISKITRSEVDYIDLQNGNKSIECQLSSPPIQTSFNPMANSQILINIVSDDIRKLTSQSALLITSHLALDDYFKSSLSSGWIDSIFETSLIIPDITMISSAFNQLAEPNHTNTTLVIFQLSKNQSTWTLSQDLEKISTKLQYRTALGCYIGTGCSWATSFGYNIMSVGKNTMLNCGTFIRRDLSETILKEIGVDTDAMMSTFRIGSSLFFVLIQRSTTKINDKMHENLVASHCIQMKDVKNRDQKRIPASFFDLDINHTHGSTIGGYGGLGGFVSIDIENFAFVVKIINETKITSAACNFAVVPHTFTKNYGFFKYGYVHFFGYIKLTLVDTTEDYVFVSLSLQPEIGSKIERQWNHQSMILKQPMYIQDTQTKDTYQFVFNHIENRVEISRKTLRDKDYIGFGILGDIFESDQKTIKIRVIRVDGKSDPEVTIQSENVYNVASVKWFLHMYGYYYHSKLLPNMFSKLSWLNNIFGPTRSSKFTLAKLDEKVFANYNQVFTEIPKLCHQLEEIVRDCATYRNFGFVLGPDQKEIQTDFGERYAQQIEVADSVRKTCLKYLSGLNIILNISENYALQYLYRKQTVNNPPDEVKDYFQEFDNRVYAQNIEKTLKNFMPTNLKEFATQIRQELSSIRRAGTSQGTERYKSENELKFTGTAIIVSKPKIDLQTIDQSTVQNTNIAITNQSKLDLMEEEEF